MILSFFIFVGLITGVRMAWQNLKESEGSWINENNALGNIIANLLFGTFLVVTMIGICIIIGMGVVLSFSAILPNIEHQEYIEIVSLNNQTSINGSFVLGTGTIREREYYFYFEKLDEDIYTRGRIKVYNVIIHEINNEVPKLKWIKVEPLQNKWTRFFLMKDISKLTYETYGYTLVVPKNTVIKEFAIK